MTKYYQCRLEKQTAEGIEPVVAWIEEKGANVGWLVELKGKEGLYTVVGVTQPPVESKDLTEKQRKDRNSLSSIKGNI